MELEIVPADTKVDGYAIFLAPAYMNRLVAGSKRLVSSLVLFSGGQLMYRPGLEEWLPFVRLVENMRREFDNPALLSRDLLEIHLLELFLRLNRMKPQEQQSNPTTTWAAERLTQFFLERLEVYFSQEKATDQPAPTVAYFARLLHVHPAHLNACIRQVLGKTAKTVISERTMIAAQSLLRHTRESIGEVTYALGFETPSYFSYFFNSSSASYFPFPVVADGSSCRLVGRASAVDSPLSVGCF